MPGGGFDASVTGVDQLAQLGRDLKECGDKSLRKEFLAAGRQLGKPVGEAFKKAAITKLPAGGGLNVWVAARMRTTTQVRLSGRNIGVRFQTRHRGARGLSDLAALNAGRARHPVYGNRSVWVLQPVPSGWIGEALAAMGEDVRKEFLAAIDRVTAQLRAGQP